MEINQGSKSMFNYNNASNMQLKVIENGFDNLVIVDENLNLDSNQLIIADLACSHGKNSMHVLKQIFDLLLKNKKLVDKINEIIVHHEDLPDNDFNEVQKCLDNEELSYLNHPLVKAMDINVSSKLIGKSYFEPLFEPESINLVVCYTAIHWMPRYKSLTYGVTYEKEYETPENVEWFENLSKNCLMDWMRLRYEELAPNGLLSMNIFADCSITHMLNTSWNGYLKKIGIAYEDLMMTTISFYFRPKSEVDDCLSLLKDKFKVHRNDYLNETYHFSREHFKAISYGQLFQGISNYPKRFPTSESKNEFIEGYYDYVFIDMKFPPVIDAAFNWVVLEKI